MEEERKPLLITEDSVSLNQPHVDKDQDAPQVQTTGTAWYMAMFLTVNAALGAGILDFPYSYHQAGGIMVGILVQAVLMVFIVGSLLLLAYCSDLGQAASYQDTVFHLLGMRARLTVAGTVAGYCFGTTITFLVIIGDQTDRVLFHVYGADFCHYWYMNRMFTISLSSILLILPMCFPKRIDFLKYASFMGVLAVVYVIILIIIEYYSGKYTATGVRTHPEHWTDVFLVVPTITFGYQCHVSVIPIYSCLKERNMKQFGKSITGALLIVIATYTFVAVFGYWTFGSDIKADVLESYVPDTPVLVGIALVAFKTYTTYPILLFCGRIAMDGIWTHVRKMSPSEIQRGERSRRICQVIGWFAATLIIAIFVPNIDVVISVLGAFAAIFIFIFPGLCLIKVVDKQRDERLTNRDKFLYVFAVAFMAVGMFLFGVTIVQCVQKDMLYARRGSNPSGDSCI